MPPITLTTRRKRDNIASFEELMNILEKDLRDWGDEIGNPVEAEQQLLDAIRQAEDDCQYKTVQGREDEIPADLFLYKACAYAQHYRNVAGHRIWSTLEVKTEMTEPDLGPAVFMLSKLQVMSSLQSSRTFDDWHGFMILYQRGAGPREERPEGSSGQRDTRPNPSRRYNEQDIPARGGMRSGPSSHSRGESVPRGLQHQPELVDREYMPRGVAGRPEGSRLASRSSLSNQVVDEEIRPSHKKTYSGHQRHGSAVHASLTMRPRRDDPRIESSEYTHLGVGHSRQMPMDSERTQKIHHSIPAADVSSGERDSYVKPRRAKHKGRKNKAPVSSSPNNTDMDEESGSGTMESHAAPRKQARRPEKVAKGKKKMAPEPSSPDETDAEEEPVHAAIKSEAVDRNPSRRSGRGAKGKKKIAPLAVATAEVSKPDDKVYPQLPVVAKPEVSGKAPPPVSMGIEQMPVTEAPKYLFGDIDYSRQKVNDKEPQPLIEYQLDELWKDQLKRHDLDKPGLYGLKPSQLGPWSVAMPSDVKYNEHIREAQLISNWTIDGLFPCLETRSLPNGKPFSVLCIKLSNHGPVRPKTTAYSLHRVPWLRRAFWRTYLLIIEWVCNMYRLNKVFPLADFFLDRSGTNKNDNMMEREAQMYLAMVTKEAKYFHGYKEQSVQPARVQKSVQRQAPSSAYPTTLGALMKPQVAGQPSAPSHKTEDELVESWQNMTPSPKLAVMMEQARNFLLLRIEHDYKPDYKASVKKLVNGMSHVRPYVNQSSRDKTDMMVESKRKLQDFVRTEQDIQKKLDDSEAGGSDAEAGTTADDGFKVVSLDLGSRKKGSDPDKHSVDTKDKDEAKDKKKENGKGKGKAEVEAEAEPSAKKNRFEPLGQVSNDLPTSESEAEHPTLAPAQPGAKWDSDSFCEPGWEDDALRKAKKLAKIRRASH